jgi:MYND finger
MAQIAFVLRNGDVTTSIDEITPLDHIEAVSNLVAIYGSMVRSAENRTVRNYEIANAMAFIFFATPEYIDAVGDVRWIVDNMGHSNSDYETLMGRCLASVLRCAKRLNRQLPSPLPGQVLDDHMEECNFRAMRRNGVRLENPACANCLARVKTWFCSRCHIYRYCSLECQREDWPNHRAVCAAVYAYAR